MQPRVPRLAAFTSLVLLAASDLVLAQISAQLFLVVGTSFVVSLGAGTLVY